jgi:hypothetical protein
MALGRARGRAVPPHRSSRGHGKKAFRTSAQQPAYQYVCRSRRYKELDWIKPPARDGCLGGRCVCSSSHELVWREMAKTGMRTHCSMKRRQHISR